MLLLGYIVPQHSWFHHSTGEPDSSEFAGSNASSVSTPLTALDASVVPTCVYTRLVTLMSLCPMMDSRTLSLIPNWYRRRRRMPGRMRHEIPGSPTRCNAFFHARVSIIRFKRRSILLDENQIIRLHPPGALDIQPQLSRQRFRQWNHATPRIRLGRHQISLAHHMPGTE